MSALTRRAATAIVLAGLALAGGPGCRKDRKSGAEATQGSASAQPVVASNDTGAAVAQPPAAGSGSVDAWFEVPPAKPSSPRARPAPPADPDAVIARFATECTAGASTPACQELRRQVERILLDTLVALRAQREPIDREWYRVAARAELPQLACIGLRELGRASDRRPADDAALVDAVENPWPFVRSAVFQFARGLPAIGQFRVRSVRDPQISSGTCVGGVRDEEPSLKWAGGYPGARFSYFASGPDRRWFTTTDPVDKVIAYFTKSGRPALTADALATAEAQKFADAANKITMSNDSDDVKTAKLTQQMAALAPIDWKAPFHDIAGDIRFVMIGPRQAIAIFKDDVLHATSIVAARPPDGTSMTPDPKSIEDQALFQTVFAD